MLFFRPVRLVALAVVAIASLVAPHAPAHHVHRWPWGITPRMMRAANHVHACEQPSSWANLGSFPGGIGMTDANWRQFRLRGMPEHAAWVDHDHVRHATPRTQARVLYRFADHYFGGQLPDQGGTCAAY